MKPLKIISGGQTGADQGGLAGARFVGIATGGWLPKFCRTEVGPRTDLLALYGMQEHTSFDYPPRTRANVRDSDGTVWVGAINSRGYHCTEGACGHYKKPFKVVNTVEELQRFVDEHRIKVLNVAGNSASKNHQIFEFTRNLIISAFGAP